MGIKDSCTLFFISKNIFQSIIKLLCKVHQSSIKKKILPKTHQNGQVILRNYKHTGIGLWISLDIQT